MTDPLDLPDDAATLLGPEERDGLIPSYITLRGELNAAEQENILEAEAWAFRRRRNVLAEATLNDLPADAAVTGAERAVPTRKNVGLGWRLVRRRSCWTTAATG
jgi:hypothetical protein